MELKHLPFTPRLVNHFALGSDPEFTFADKFNHYVHAETLGLNTMSAFGCDMAGRQAELRAYPSRFALEVVASMVDALRWMTVAHGGFVLPLQWLAKAWNGKDGCGGHIHFGRKSADRKKTVDVLDSTARLLLKTGVLNSEDCEMRYRNTNYGRYGDVRPQVHGFEYRTLPTALENPWLCYFIMVINKLSVHEGVSLGHPQSTSSPIDIYAWLRKYAGMDDDAAIALEGLKVHGFPKMIGTDMKPNWGLPFYNPLVPQLNLERTFFPSIMKPEEQTCHELFEYFTKNTLLPNRQPVPTWNLFSIPRGFHKIKVQEHTLGHLPDVGRDLISKEYEIHLEIQGGNIVFIDSDCILSAKRVKKSLGQLKEYPVRCSYSTYPPKQIIISVPTAFNKSLEQCQLLHKVLADTTLFPVCKVKDFHKVDWTYWDSMEMKSPKLLGKIKVQVKGKKSEVNYAIPSEVQVRRDYVGAKVKYKVVQQPRLNRAIGNPIQEEE